MNDVLVSVTQEIKFMVTYDLWDTSLADDPWAKKFCKTDIRRLNPSNNVFSFDTLLQRESTMVGITPLFLFYSSLN